MFQAPPCHDRDRTSYSWAQVDIRMAQSRGTFVGTTVGLVLASLGVLVIIAGASIWLALRTESDFAQLLRARAIRTATVDLMSLIQDAETGQRGYLLTHDQSYLVPYTQAVAHFDQLFSEFRGTVADSPDLRPATEQLSSLLRLKLAELKTTVDLAQNGQFASAMSTVNGNKGKALMNEARGIFAELLERSDNDLKASVAAQKEKRYIGFVGRGQRRDRCNHRHGLRGCLDNHQIYARLA
jgi:CHASE3 domain sensor protein